MPTRFRFRWIPFIAAVTVASLGIVLGNWQTRRAHQKEAMEAKMTVGETAPPLMLGAKPVASANVEYRRVAVEGRFLPAWTIYLDNRPYQGIPGFYVLMPLKIAGTDMHVLVARGWVPRDVSDRAKVPSIPSPPDIVRIEGVAKRSAGRLLQLGEADVPHPKAILQNLEVADFARAAGIELQPFIVEQTTDMNDGLVRDWPHPSLGIERHRGYAFQWYALAATALLFFLVTGFKRGTD